MKRFKVLGIGVMALLIVTIALQNTESVDTNILFYTITLPRALLLAATAAIGFIIGVLSSFRIRSKK